MSDGQEEVFPPEIEEIIFSLAVQTDWTCAKGLIFVAKRVYQWIVPQVYNVALFHSEQCPDSRPRYDSGHLLRHGRHVRHILMFNPLLEWQSLLHHRPSRCLEWCPNAVNVALWVTKDQYDKALINQLLRLPVTHLSLDFGHLMKHLNVSDSGGSDKSFPTVTHLEIISTSQPFTLLELQDVFPNLTHLALNAFSAYTFPPSMVDILEVWKDQMKVFIWYRGESENDVPVIVPSGKPLDDPRIVWMQYGRGYAGTWYEGTRGGLSIWKLAEETIERKVLMTETA